MKVRLSSWNGLSKKQREEIDRYIKVRGLEVYQAETEGLYRRFLKIMAVSLNEKYGFGKKRLIRLFDHVTALNKQREQDEVFWWHIDKVVINQLKIDFEKEPYDDLDR